MGLLPRCRGLCIGRPVCPGASGRLHVCVRQSVQGSRQVCAETERQLLFLLPWLTQETARLRPHTEATALRGVGTEAQILPASLRRSRIQRGTAAAHRGILEVLPWQDAVSL